MVHQDFKKIIYQRTLPKYFFPRLINRTSSQREMIKSTLKENDHLIDYYKQLFDHYIFTFFYNNSLSLTKRMKLGNIEGIFKSSIDLPSTENIQFNEFNGFNNNSDFNLIKSKDIKFNGLKNGSDSTFNKSKSSEKIIKIRKDFFKFIRKVPIPFLFIPLGGLDKVLILELINEGYYKFKIDSNQAILMNLDIATDLGVEFIGGDILSKEQISLYYIGFLVKDITE